MPLFKSFVNWESLSGVLGHALGIKLRLSVAASLIYRMVKIGNNARTEKLIFKLYAIRQSTQSKFSSSIDLSSRAN